MVDRLSEVFDIEPIEQTLPVTTTTVVPVTDDVEDSDFDNVRTNTYELIDQSKAAVNTALRVAAESENPRALEVLGQLLKTSAEINKQLLALSKDKADIKQAKNVGKSSSGPQIGVQNAVFVGSSADLNKMLADRSSK